jgi:hypothetical protein
VEGCGHRERPYEASIHQLEADQPMLRFIKPLWGKLQAHFTDFSADNAELSKDKVPADRRKSNPQPTKIALVQLLEQDHVKLWHPAMDAAAELDPGFWKKNARKLYFVPVATLNETEREKVE